MDPKELQASLEEGGFKFLSQEDVINAQAEGQSQGQEGEGDNADNGVDQGQEGGNQEVDAQGEGQGDQAAQGDPAQVEQKQEPQGDPNRVVYTPAEEPDGQQQGSQGDQGGDDLSPEEISAFVDNYLQESLGMTLEQIGKSKPAVDERIQPILDFIEKTGRGPEEWFLYQQMDPTKMDDKTVLTMEIMAQYPDLDRSEVQLMLESKYKIDDDLLDDRERKVLDLQMKMDANKARKSISEMRDGYTLPKESGKQTPSAPQGIVNDRFLSEAYSEIEALEGIDFEIGEKTFTFGLNNSTKNALKGKNAQIDAYLDQYKAQDGSWNHELFNVHQTVLSNIDEIVKAVYNQGISDGQRKVVTGAANIDNSSPKQGQGNQSVSKLEEQITQILGGSNQMMTIKF